MTAPSDYRGLSLWLDTLADDLTPRPPLVDDVDADVAIVGGGFTGLWTAYYLSERQPDIRVALIEREICGFGASGRNGGWCVGGLAAGVERYAALSSHDDAMRLMREVFSTIDEIAEVTAAEGIDCGFAKGGWVSLARNSAQAVRQAEAVERQQAHGFRETDLKLLSADEARSMVHATDVQSGVFFAHCAVLNPAQLVRGLAKVVEHRGVKIYEQTEAVSISPGIVETKGGVVRADVVLRATEGYTRDLPGERRTLVPLYSLMVATEPVSESVMQELGLEGRPAFSDDRYAVIYGQRTADDRIAFGGRGVPYLFGSRVDRSTETHPPTHALVRKTLQELFPVLRDIEITHQWGGVLGVPRNWTPSVVFDRHSGLATAGGYVGEGVCAANLAGRTLADLITGTDSDLVNLPWVNVHSRKWEPEPLRWIGIRGTRRVMQSADAKEFASDDESNLGKWAAKLL
jgi:glycine/D-amino acid oxidase-like deaminating enzyme